MSKYIDGEDAVRTAIASLLFVHPFFGLLIGKLKMRRNDSLPTMATDGETLFYNEDFVLSLKKSELEGVLAHEAMHVALGHPIRGARFMKARGVNWGEEHFHSGGMTGKQIIDTQKMLQAMDYADNAILHEAGKTLPKGCLHDPKFKNMSWEEIFAKLPDPKVMHVNIPCPSCGEGGKDEKDGQGQGQGQDGQDQKQGKGSGQGKKPASGHQHGQGGGSGGDQPCGGVLPYPAHGDDALDQAEMNHRVMVTQAAQAAKMQGTLPAGIEEYVNGLNDPKVNWAEQLRRFVENITKDDYSWQRPNRRYVQGGFMLPTLYNKTCGVVVVTCDTSGSVSSETLEQFATEVSDIIASAKPEKVIVIHCDAEIAGVQEFEPDELPIVLECKGRGGTDFRPPFRYIEEQGIEPVCHIYLTDLYGPFPDKEPPYPTIWVGEPAADPNAKPPFGELIYMEPKGRH